MTQPSDIAEMVRKALEEALRDRGHVNVLIAGRTGVGKSTLINAVFQGRLAETGQGRPVTQSTREYTKEGLPLSVWDTRGFELSAFKESVGELERLIAERARDRDPNRHIHVAWLCVHEDGRRVEEAEIELQNTLSRHMPVLGVITKARADQGFRAEVQRLLPLTSNVIRVRAIAEQFDEGPGLPPMGLPELVEASCQLLPEGTRRAFVAAQKASIQEKKNAGHKIVVTAASAAAAAGASPIPFSDAVILVPIQLGMLAGISSVFGLELSKAFLSTIVASAAGSTGATLAGRAIVANLLKLIPGGGTVVGGVISASTAAVLTTTLGEVYIGTLGAVLARSGGEVPEVQVIADEFTRRLAAKRAS